MTAIDWDYVKELLCRQIREKYLPRLRQLHDMCFQDGALKSLAEKCVALYVMYYLDRNRYYSSFEEFAAYLRLQRRPNRLLGRFGRAASASPRRRAPPPSSATGCGERRRTWRCRDARFIRPDPRRGP
ncbi:hypothetical protein [Pyrobaculum aerophilum]|uniref:Uncharacterized protein n=1 Tax=Pyrobaculum aerophilum TaxID=13773 RepID=A0A371R0D4_9CREN|nr:hypothetical protein [Pyrobaculum aerophilum]RFA94526.1 hypothetical protein CGL52_14310 [Pyrobaculum aerophilum]RFA96758.1 hypothetical protein CGL51_04370 [Pyrobaculum aerophilum]